ATEWHVGLARWSVGFFEGLQSEFFGRVTAPPSSPAPSQYAPTEPKENTEVGIRLSLPRPLDRCPDSPSVCTDLCSGPRGEPKWSMKGAPPAHIQTESSTHTQERDNNISLLCAEVLRGVTNWTQEAHVKVTAVVSEMLLSPISPPLGFCQTGSQMSASSLCCDHDPPFSPCTSPGSVEVEMKPCPVLGGEDIVITFQCACTTEAVPALPI
ncbi:hypothetical protein KUCAC02_035637, partial [Chaenocephalus aceratus]